MPDAATPPAATGADQLAADQPTGEDIARIALDALFDVFGAAAILRRLLGPADDPAAADDAPAAGDDADGDDQDEPVPRPRAARPRARRPEGGDVGDLIDRLVARHGSLTAVAEVVGMSRAGLAHLRAGRTTPRPSTLARLRAAAEGDGAEPADGAEGDTAEGDGAEGDHDGGDGAEPEQVALVRALVARRGSVESAGLAYGFGDGALRRWMAGGPCSPSTLARLREAAREATRAAPLDGAAQDAGDPDGADLG
ncbi:MAG: helix-turn-helix domain-containing protein [Planctomycetes bacterium]|nr:helix-turn-helix domain-containing protein [Planctomycetota bacterium]